MPKTTKLSQETHRGNMFTEPRRSAAHATALSPKRSLLLRISVVTVIVLALASVGGLSYAQATPTLFMHAVEVTNVVDGDTIDVIDNGETKRIRLLNVNTPETVDPDKPVECGGTEASTWLKNYLPIGTRVKLDYDKEFQDSYGRDLAAVYKDGVLVDAEIARQGLGAAMSVGTNVKHLDEVQKAQAEAESKNIGLYSPSNDCSLTGKVATYTSSSNPTATTRPVFSDTIESLDAKSADLNALIDSGNALLALLDGDRNEYPLALYSNTVIDAMRASVSDRLSSSQVQSETISARRAKLQQEADRKAQELAEQEQAVKEAAAQAAEKAREAKEAAEAKSRSSNGSSSNSRGGSSNGSPSQGNGSSSSNSTGRSSPSTGNGSAGRPKNAAPCRKYAPGGKTFTYIDCTTKQPL